MSVTLGYELVNVRIVISALDESPSECFHEQVRLVMIEGAEISQHLKTIEDQLPDILASLNYDPSEYIGAIESIEIASDEVVLLVDDNEDETGAEDQASPTGAPADPAVH
jgi:hypothetical protein